MMMVDVDRGRAEAQALAKTLEELDREPVESEGEFDDNLSEDVRSVLEESYSYQRAGTG